MQLVPLTLALLALSISAQFEVQPTNGPDSLIQIGNPTEDGNAWFKSLPFSRIRSASGTLTIGTIENVFISTTEWPSGSPDFYELLITEANATFGGGVRPLRPDLNAIIASIDLGNSGLPDPCTQPNPPPGCPGCAFYGSGYVVDIELDAPIVVPAPTLENDAEGISLVALLPEGMTFTPDGTGTGPCGWGNYVFMGELSTDEDQANVTGNNASITTGFISGGSPGSYLKSSMAVPQLGFATPVIEATVGDPFNGIAPARGGASLAFETSQLSAQFAATVIADADRAGELCLAFASMTPLANPVPLFGADLLVFPDRVVQESLGAWVEADLTLAAVDTDGDGVPEQSERETAFTTLPALGGLRLYLQAFIFTSTSPAQAISTTSWAIDFL